MHQYVKDIRPLHSTEVGVYINIGIGEVILVSRAYYHACCDTLYHESNGLLRMAS